HTVFANAISGSGTVVQNLALDVGTTTLTGSNTYTGGTTVTGGTLYVDNATGSGTGSGSVTVSPGSPLYYYPTLGGTGTISGSVEIDAACNLAPGGPSGTIGTLTVGGNVTFDSATSTHSALQIYVATGGVAGVDYDQLKVSGSITIGSNVDLSVTTS